MQFLLKIVYMFFMAKMAESYKVQAKNAIDVALDEIVSKKYSQCSLVLMPKDGEVCESARNCYLDIDIKTLESLELSRSVSWTASLTSHLDALHQCLVVLLPTLAENRILDIFSILAMTRTKTSVIVITDIKMTDLFYNVTIKANFDSYMISKLTEESSHYEVISREVKDSKSWNLVNVAFRAMPFAILPRGKGRYIGIDWEILKEASRRTGIKFKLHMSKSYAAMIKEVATDSADMAISSATFSYDRYQTAGDISTSYGFRNVFLITRKGQQIAAYWTLIYPFDMYSWIILAISVLSTALCIFVLNIVKLANNEPGPQMKGLHIFGTTFVYLLKVAVPQEWAGIVLLFVWMPTGLLMSMMYTETLLASLVSVQLEKPVKTWQELIDRDMTLYIQKGVILNDIMQKSPIPLVREVYQKCVLENNGLVDRDMTPESRRGQLSNKAATLGSLGGRKENPWFLEGDHLTADPLGMYYIRKFPWKKEIDQVIQNFFEASLVNKLKADTYFRFRKNEREYERSKNTSKWNKLHLTHFKLVWWLLGVTLMICLVAFVWEVMQHKALKLHMKKKIRKSKRKEFSSDDKFKDYFTAAMLCWLFLYRYFLIALSSDLFKLRIW